MRDVVAWARASAPGSELHVIEATNELRELSNRPGNTDPRLWVMAVGRDVIEMWSESGQPPVLVIRRSGEVHVAVTTT